MDLNLDIIPESQSMKPPSDANQVTPPEEAGKHHLPALLELKTPIINPRFEATTPSKNYYTVVFVIC